MTGLRSVLVGILCSSAISTAALAQGAPTLSSMPRPPSFDDPSPGTSVQKPRKTKRSTLDKATNAQTSGPKTGASFDRPDKFVPAEFDHERRGGSGAGAGPVMSGSGRPGMGMRF